MVTTTTNCSEFSHPEFRISIDKTIPKDDVEWLVSVLERSVRDGRRYEHGQLVDLGSMLLRIQLADDGALVIEEPDFREIPICWTLGVTHSLRLLRLQKDTAESVRLGDHVDFPTLRRSVLLGADVDSNVERFVMDRANSDDADSGWFIGRLDSRIDYSDPSNLRRVSVYEAVVSWPQLAGFLAMPSGTRVESAPDRLAMFYREQALIPTEGSFLDLASK